jgi:formate dehydrogenase maturation protein FdhE
MDWRMELLTQLGTTSNYSAIADLHTLQISSTRQVFSFFTSRILATDFNTVIITVSLYLSVYLSIYWGTR